MQTTLRLFLQRTVTAKVPADFEVFRCGSDFTRRSADTRPLRRRGENVRALSKLSWLVCRILIQAGLGLTGRTKRRAMARAGKAV
jgi:hypothetical protein